MPCCEERRQSVAYLDRRGEGQIGSSALTRPQKKAFECFTRREHSRSRVNEELHSETTCGALDRRMSGRPSHFFLSQDESLPQNCTYVTKNVVTPVTNVYFGFTSLFLGRFADQHAWLIRANLGLQRIFFALGGNNFRPKVLWGWLPKSYKYS